MDPEVQAHILNNLKDLNVAVSKIDQSQQDVIKRFDRTIDFLTKTNDKVDKVEERVGDLESAKTVLAWKLGTISAGAGAALAIGAQWLAVKLGFKL